MLISHGYLYQLQDIIEEPLNAIGLIRWQGSEAPPVKAEEKPKPVKARKPFKVKKPVEIPEEELDEGPFGPLPHRSAGYGRFVKWYPVTVIMQARMLMA